MRFRHGGNKGRFGVVDSPYVEKCDGEKCDGSAAYVLERRKGEGRDVTEVATSRTAICGPARRLHIPWGCDLNIAIRRRRRRVASVGVSQPVPVASYASTISFRIVPARSLLASSDTFVPSAARTTHSACPRLSVGE